MFKECIIGWYVTSMKGMCFGTHGTQLHGKQLSSYKLQVW